MNITKFQNVAGSVTSTCPPAIVYFGEEKGLIKFILIVAILKWEANHFRRIDKILLTMFDSNCMPVKQFTVSSKGFELSDQILMTTFH